MSSASDVETQTLGLPCQAPCRCSIQVGDCLAKEYFALISPATCSISVSPSNHYYLAVENS